MRLYVDLDGVLADFHGHWHASFGFDPKTLDRNDPATEAIVLGWVDTDPTFWTTMPPCDGAAHLWRAVCAASHEQPTILCGVPRVRATEKESYARENYPEARVIMLSGRHKASICRPGDILIDDWPKYAQLWYDAGGHFIHHIDAATSIAKLKELQNG